MGLGSESQTRDTWCVMRDAWCERRDEDDCRIYEETSFRTVMNTYLSSVHIDIRFIRSNASDPPPPSPCR